MTIEVWRDTPKPGETDAKWCASYNLYGHVLFIVTEKESAEEARMAVKRFMHGYSYDMFRYGKQIEGKAE